MRGKCPCRFKRRENTVLQTCVSQPVRHLTVSYFTPVRWGGRKSEQTLCSLVRTESAKVLCARQCVGVLNKPCLLGFSSVRSPCLLPPGYIDPGP